MIDFLINHKNVAQLSREEFFQLILGTSSWAICLIKVFLNKVSLFIKKGA